MATPGNKLAFDDGWHYSPAPESTDHIRIDKRYKLFIGGEFVAPEKGHYFDTINPATEEPLSRVGLATAADVDKAVKAARKAYGPWSRMKARRAVQSSCGKNLKNLRVRKNRWRHESRMEG